MEHIPIIAPGDPGFDWLYDLYMQSFPVHEQRLRERQEGVLGHPEYHCDLLCQGETRVGLLMWWAGPGFRYVEHFAIAPQLRGQSWAAGHCVSSWRRETRWCWKSILRENYGIPAQEGLLRGAGPCLQPMAPHPSLLPPGVLRPRPGGDDLSRRLGRGTVPALCPISGRDGHGRPPSEGGGGVSGPSSRSRASASPVRSPRRKLRRA